MSIFFVCLALKYMVCMKYYIRGCLAQCWNIGIWSSVLYLTLFSQCQVQNIILPIGQNNSHQYQRMMELYEVKCGDTEFRYCMIQKIEDKVCWLQLFISFLWSPCFIFYLFICIFTTQEISFLKTVCAVAVFKNVFQNYVFFSLGNFITKLWF